MMPLKEIDEGIRMLQEAKDSESDPMKKEIFQELIAAFTMIRDSQADIAKELIAMYQSASEHNVDIGRKAVYDLAQRIAGSG